MRNREAKTIATESAVLPAVCMTNKKQLPNKKLTLDEAIAHAQECADDTPCGHNHAQLAEWLKELRILKATGGGNAAAMRDALVEIERRVNSLDEECGVDPIEVRDIARAGLAKPQRNCDFYDNKTDAETGFIEETEEDDNNPLYWQLFANWLFAPSEKRREEDK